MGLFENVLAKKIHLAWMDEERSKIKPEWYLAIEANYKIPRQKSPLKIKQETETWLGELADIFHDVPAQSRYLSGTLGVFALLNDYPWFEPFTELSLFAQEPILNAMVAAAANHHFYLMRRISAKFSAGSRVKYHFFSPVTVEDALGPRRQLRRNLELTRIDPAADVICQEFVPRNHIQLRLHRNLGGDITCIGDKHPKRFPPACFKGIACTVAGQRMFVMDPRYTLLKERQAISYGETRHPEKHQDIIRRLELYLAAHHQLETAPMTALH